MQRRTWLVFFVAVAVWLLSPRLTFAATEADNTKFGIDAVPYVMAEYENCNPRTLKRPDGQDCWQSWNLSLPANRPDYYFGGFGSQIELLWSETQIGPNEYDWSWLDTYLAGATDMPQTLADGTRLPYKPVIITLGEFLQSSSDPHDGQKDFVAYVPEFVKQAVGDNQFQVSLSGCDTQDQVPYHSAVFQQYYQAWIRAVGQHLQQLPSKYVVQAVLMGGGVSSEAIPAKSLQNCDYKGAYVGAHQQAYDQFYQSLMGWLQAAMNPAPVSGDPAIPVFAQIAAAAPVQRVAYAQAALDRGVGIKLNSLAPANGNSYKTVISRSNGGRGGLYDYVSMTPQLAQPRAFEPYYYPDVPTTDHCAAEYCYSDAKYQYTYWNYLTALSQHADFTDMQKAFFGWKQQLTAQFGLNWFPNLIEHSLGKAQNQTTIAWVAFADRLSTQDSYPNPRPSAPIYSGTGDYFPAEFAERGDKDFYLYRMGTQEESNLIRAQGGLVTDDGETYAIATNACYRSTAELVHQATKILTGQQLRNSGKLAASQYAHPFSTTALSTDAAAGKYYVSLNLDDGLARLKNAQVQLVVEYLDAGSDTFSVEYQTGSGQARRVSQTKTNTRTWKEARWTLPAGELSFDNTLTGGADLRLNCDCESGGGDDIYHMVRIEAESPQFVSTAPTTTAPSFCPRGSSTTCSPEYDLNQDGSVDLRDYSILISQLFQTGSNTADFNCDQVVDLRDFSLLIQHFSL